MHEAKSKMHPRKLTTYGRTRAVRLPDCDYGAGVNVHCTLCAYRGAPFTDDTVARMVCGNIEFYCGKLSYTLFGYCLMPDHLHVLMSPSDSAKDLAHWTNVFKSYTTHEYLKMGGQPPLWQRSWHDHVCRKEEAVETVVAYIANNPVRAGLVADWRDWRWTRVFDAV